MDFDPVERPTNWENQLTWRPGAHHFAATLGMSAPRNVWETAVHANSGYELYMRDRLPQAAKAIRRAMLGHAWPQWLGQLLYVTEGELEARDFGRRVECPPFIFEVPADDPDADPLIDLTETHASRAEKLLAADRQPTLFTFLPPDTLIDHSHSRHGYMVPKLPYYKICLPYEPGKPISRLARGLVHEYVHVLENELSQGESPRWLREGLAEWADGELVDQEEVDDLVLLPGEYPRLGEIEGLFSSGHHIDDEEMDYAYAAALSAVAHLADRHGLWDVRDLLARLRKQREGAAFKDAFGESERAFEKAWHQWLKENPVQMPPLL
ncbi:MAG: hypothetical protein FJX75_05925 [Armatimonadetes bacterium]|nr:hypothetical protein [Armatimonadota bacterium]